MTVMYCVYMHTAPNGKVYIGITGKNPLYRWQRGHGYRNNTYFTNAIVKYGWDNFKHEILFDGLSKEEAGKIESELILKHKSNNPEFGYNILAGGQLSRTGIPCTDEHKQKTSHSLMGHWVSEETKEKIRNARARQTFFGIRRKASGRENNKAHSVNQYDEFGNLIRSFETVSEAAKYNSVCHQSISDCCNGKLKRVKGFVFVYGNLERR